MCSYPRYLWVSKRIYLENGSLHVTDSAHDVTITFALSRKKLLGVGLAMIFAAYLDLGGIFFRNVLTIKASRQARSPQSGPGPVDDRKNITVVECAAPTFEEAENIVRDYRYIGPGSLTPLHRRQQSSNLPKTMYLAEYPRCHGLDAPHWDGTIVQNDKSASF